MDFLDFESQRQKKRMSHKLNKTNNNTKRNKIQKERQYYDRLKRSYLQNERQQKQNIDTIDECRHYYCNQCHKTFEKPCQCQWSEWCGVEGNYYKCSYYNYLSETFCSYHEMSFHKSIYEN
jgi:hypothetical protein